MWAAHARAPPGTHESRTRGQWDGAGAGVLGIRIFKPPPPAGSDAYPVLGTPEGSGACSRSTSPGDQPRSSRGLVPPGSHPGSLGVWSRDVDKHN